MLDASAAKSSRRKSSRSNSTSSSSIVTVKRAASLSSKPGSRTPHLQDRARSPEQTTTSALRPQLAENLAQNERRASSSHSRSNSFGTVKEGIGNLNRWSQSTTSSRVSGNGHSNNGSIDQSKGRRRSFTRRLSIGGTGTFGNTRSATNHPSPTRNVLTKAQSSSPTKVIDNDETPTLSLDFTSSLMSQFSSNADENVAPGSRNATPGLITPSAQSIDYGDYFVNTWAGSTAGSSTVGPLVGEAASSDSRAPTTDHSAGLSSKSRNAQSRDTLQPSGGIVNEVDDLRAGHSRNREGNKGSGGTDISSTSSTRSERGRSKKHRPQSQKTMLSKALQKANTAVLLDNAQNFEGAMEAYEDACRLLEQVMFKSTGVEDKRKLQSIRTTYINRIKELQGLESMFQVSNGKALPDRPLSDTSVSTRDRDSAGYDEDGVVIGTATATRIINSTEEFDQYQSPPEPASQPQPNQSLLPSIFSDDVQYDQQLLPQTAAPRNFSRSSFRENGRSETPRGLAPPSQSEYMPAPLSPRRGKSPNNAYTASDASKIDESATYARSHSRENSNESTSWLDTIEESGGSSASSVHSRTSSLGFRRRRLHSQSHYDETEAEFEAALDAAVEAAYDDGYDIPDEIDETPAVDDIILQNRRNVELAKQRVREAELEAAYAEETWRSQGDNSYAQQKAVTDPDYLENEEEEEERILDEMTRGYVLDEFEFDLQTKSALPRQSDSSGFSGRTWPSSMGSNTANTSLTPSTDSMGSAVKQKVPPGRAPPTSSLPTPPVPSSVESASRTTTTGQAFPASSGVTSLGAPGVRERRLSGQNPKQLTIETSQRSKTEAKPPQSTLDLSTSNEDLKTATQVIHPKRLVTAPLASTTSQNETDIPAIPREMDLTRNNAPGFSSVNGPINGDGLETLTSSRYQKPLTKMTSAPDTMKKNQPFPSLKTRNLSVSTPEGIDTSPITPGSARALPFDARREAPPTVPAIPTPTGATFFANGLPTGGMHLFDDHMESPSSPGESGAQSLNVPMQLEPCPESFLLRPFWLMRCLDQTLVHPRGGYVSTKLFIPRDVWRVKGVKLKGVEEKISCCDLLTAALQKLARVDTYDADAVLEEMQAFEIVLEQVRATLSKKLGSEVGVQNLGHMFKGASHIDENASADPLAAKSTNAQAKSYLSGWRKLRNKSSGAGLTPVSSNHVTKDGGQNGLTLSSLPMTSSITTRPMKRATSQIPFSGPQANYMGALARLFDAVQVLDQIARQVEDPGLKYSSKTHVGLELSTRNAAEFFGFYICRFALNDVSILLDKFIKRGSEWVLV